MSTKALETETPEATTPLDMEAAVGSITEEGTLLPHIEEEINAHAKKLMEEGKAKRVYPIVVIGDRFAGEKEYYVGYFAQPTFAQFSKFMAAGKKDELIAIRTLAKDVFLEGDRCLVDDDSMFVFGAFPQIQSVMAVRQSYIVNLSTAGKY